MDWEEHERLRKERRAQRRKLHEKVGSTNTDRQSETERGDKTSGQPRHQSVDQDPPQADEPKSVKRPQKNTKQKPQAQSRPKQGKKTTKSQKNKGSFKKLASNLAKKVNPGKQQANEPKYPQKSGTVNRSEQVATQEKKPVEKKRVPWLKRIILLTPFIIALVVAGYFASPLNHVASVSVNGVNDDEETVVLDPLSESMSVYQLKQRIGEIEQTIVNQNPSVESATVTVEGWNNVVVNVSTYRQLGYIQIEDFYYPVLENNQVLDTPLPSLDKDLPLIEGFDISDDKQKEKFTETVKAFSTLPDDIIQQISLITYTGDEDNADSIALQMVDGNVVVGFINSIGDRMSYYNGMLSQLDGQTGLIDMEVAIFFTELNDGNNPYASEEDKAAYEESIAAESASSEEASSTSLDPDAVSAEGASIDAEANAGDSSSDTTDEATADQSSTAEESQISE